MTNAVIDLRRYLRNSRATLCTVDRVDAILVNHLDQDGFPRAAFTLLEPEPQTEDQRVAQVGRRLNRRPYQFSLLLPSADAISLNEYMSFQQYGQESIFVLRKMGWEKMR